MNYNDFKNIGSGYQTVNTDSSVVRDESDEAMNQLKSVLKKVIVDPIPFFKNKLSKGSASTSLELKETVSINVVSNKIASFDCTCLFKFTASIEYDEKGFETRFLSAPVYKLKIKGETKISLEGDFSFIFDIIKIGREQGFIIEGGMLFRDIDHFLEFLCNIFQKFARTVLKYIEDNKEEILKSLVLMTGGALLIVPAAVKIYKYIVDENNLQDEEKVVLNELKNVLLESYKIEKVVA
jgi:hypothetical protein